MSDFLFCTAPRPPGELRSALDRFLGEVAGEIVERHGGWGSLAVVRAAHDGEVAHEEGGWISVLAGDPLLRGEGRGARGWEGARRGELHRELRDAGQLARSGRLDGAYAALAIECDARRVAVLTDRASFVTVYRAEAGGGVLLGTHPDATARAAGRGGDIDPVSAADLLLNLAPTYPYTLYRGVTQLPPATVTELGGGAAERSEVYWRPVERVGYRSLDEAATALRDAIVDDARLACDGLDEVGLLLSGGEDARAVLGAVPAGVRVQAVTYADWRSREVRIAHAAARAHGADFTFGRREPDHYLGAFPKVAALLGSGNLFIDVHGYGFHNSLGLDRLPLVLGGLSSDSFLKARHSPADRDPRAPFRSPPVAGIRPELVEAVSDRRTEFRRWLAEIRPGSAREWERIWPFSMRKHGGNLHGNRRLFRSHEPYHCNGVLEVAAGVPVEWKRHRALFNRAVRPLLRPSWRVPHADLRYPYFGRWANLPLGAGLAVARGVRAAATGQLRARQRPWPKWGRVVESEAMRALVARNPPGRGPLAGLFVPGADPGRTVAGKWHPLRRLLLLQLSFLVERAGD